MDPILGLMFVLACWEAAKHGWGHARDARRASRGTHVKQAQNAAGGVLAPRARRRAARQHDAAWWGREVAHGFPVYRTGWHSSWLAHKTAADHHKARREEARTNHLNTRVAILREIPEHKRRQAEAQKLIDEALEKAGQQAGGKKAVEEAGDELARKRAGKTVPPLPADTVQPTRRVDGKPETGADKRFFDLRESGYEGPIDRDGHAVMSRTTSDGTPLPLFGDGTGNPGPAKAEGSQKAVPAAASPASATEFYDPSPLTKGSSVATAEMNYTQALETAQQIETEAENEVNSLRRQRIANALDALTGMGLEGRTLSDFAEVDDDLKEAQKTMEKLHEDAVTARQNLVRDHGDLKEAHDNAPVRAAEREFYEGD